MFNKIEVTEENYKVGDKVVRGKDWEWGDQDGFKGSVGIITGTWEKKAWVYVDWLSAGSNVYRIGAEDCYDLYFYTGEVTDSLMHRIGHLLLNK